MAAAPVRSVCFRDRHSIIEEHELRPFRYADESDSPEASTGSCQEQLDQSGPPAAGTCQGEDPEVTDRTKVQNTQAPVILRNTQNPRYSPLRKDARGNRNSCFEPLKTSPKKGPCLSEAVQKLAEELRSNNRVTARHNIASSDSYLFSQYRGSLMRYRYENGFVPPNQAHNVSRSATFNEKLPPVQENHRQEYQQPRQSANFYSIRESPHASPPRRTRSNYYNMTQYESLSPKRYYRSPEQSPSHRRSYSHTLGPRNREVNRSFQNRSSSFNTYRNRDSYCCSPPPDCSDSGFGGSPNPDLNQPITEVLHQPIRHCLQNQPIRDVGNRGNLDDECDLIDSILAEAEISVRDKPRNRNSLPMSSFARYGSPERGLGYPPIYGTALKRTHSQSIGTDTHRRPLTKQDSNESTADSLASERTGTYFCNSPRPNVTRTSSVQAIAPRRNLSSPVGSEISTLTSVSTQTFDDDSSSMGSRASLLRNDARHGIPSSHMCFSCHICKGLQKSSSVKRKPSIAHNGTSTVQEIKVLFVASKGFDRICRKIGKMSSKINVSDQSYDKLTLKKIIGEVKESLVRSPPRETSVKILSHSESCMSFGAQVCTESSPLALNVRAVGSDLRLEKAWDKLGAFDFAYELVSYRDGAPRGLFGRRTYQLVIYEHALPKPTCSRVHTIRGLSISSHLLVASSLHRLLTARIQHHFQHC